MISEAKKKADTKYRAKAIVQKKIDLNRNTDQDILEWLEDKAFATYVKELIRKDIQSHQRPSE